MIEFVIPDQPVHQGSMRAYTVPRADGRMGARAAYTNEGDLKKYRKRVVAAYANRAPAIDGPILIEVVFFMRRPQNHWGSGRNAGVLKDWAPEAPTVYPDLDKLIRALGDSLSGVAWKDDAQIIHWDAKKLYANQAGPRTVVRIRPAKTPGGA